MMYWNLFWQIKLSKEGRKLILDTDARFNGIGAKFSQIQIEKLNIIAYRSITYQKVSKIYCCTTYRELWAGNVFVKHFKHFFMETIFWFELVMLLLLDWEILKNPEGMLARWTSNLETCDNELVQRKALICRQFVPYALSLLIVSTVNLTHLLLWLQKQKRIFSYHWFQCPLCKRTWNMIT